MYFCHFDRSQKEEALKFRVSKESENSAAEKVLVIILLQL